MKRLLVSCLLVFICAVSLLSVSARASTATSLAEVSRQIVCQCPDCGKQTVDQCAPGCGEGRELRALIQGQVDKGQSAAQVINFIADNKGEHMLASPRSKGFGVAAYALPPLFAALSLIPLALVLRSRRRKTPEQNISATQNSEPSTDNSAAADDPRVAAALRNFDF